MAEYYIRKLNFADYEVSKHDGDVLLSSYIVRHELQPRPHFTCICPRWMRKTTVACRHTGMVQEFINQGEPGPFCLIRE